MYISGENKQQDLVDDVRNASKRIDITLNETQENLNKQLGQ